MSLLVGTDSYVTEAEIQAYADKRGISITGDITILGIKAMDYIEVQSYKSTKTVSTQALQFPRILCSMYSTDCEYDNDEVPNDIKNAQIVAALLVDGGNDLQPIEGRATKKEKVDVLEVEYMDSASNSNTYTQLDDLLRPFVTSSGLRTVRI